MKFPIDMLPAPLNGCCILSSSLSAFLCGLLPLEVVYSSPLLPIWTLSPSALDLSLHPSLISPVSDTGLRTQSLTSALSSLACVS